MFLQLCHQSINLSIPQIVGVLNVTPDSMFDGGRYTTLDAVLTRVEEMIKEGATIIDIGGESTRPAAVPIIPQEELNRVAPVIKAIRSRFDIPLSIDTSQPLVMKAAIEVGADMINDVRALRAEGALEAIAQLKVPVCLMHMSYPFGKKENAIDPLGQDPVTSIKNFFTERLVACEEAGIEVNKIMLDPGFGTGNFGKNVEQNLEILRHLNEFQIFQRPIWVGVSYKTFISEVLAVPLKDRLAGSLAATVLAVERGATFIRSHDVKVTREVVELTMAIMRKK